MTGAVITAVRSKLAELAANEVGLQLQVGEDMILLRDRLEWLQAFVRAADRKRRAGTDGLTQVWVRQTRDVAFQAEDALDDFFYEEGRERRWKILHRYVTGLFTKIVVRHVLYYRIKMIKSRLDQISVNQKEYNIVHTPLGVSTSSITAIAAWRDDMENAVGFEEDVHILKHMLTRGYGGYKNGSDQKQLMFISIVGESGAGKSTLAKIICRKMNTEMQVVIWCHMEPGSSSADLLQKVYQQASTQCVPAVQQGGEVVNLYIGDKLRHLLEGKGYLLILSGISSNTILNSLRASLQHPNQDDASGNLNHAIRSLRYQDGNSISGGRVMLILDTENEEVAWHANTMNQDGINGIHLLTRLDQERSGKLFFWKVFRKGQYKISSYKEETSESRNWDGSWEDKELQKKDKEQRKKDQEDNDRDVHERLVHNITEGYPMAIVLLAGLLRFKEKPAQWDAVLQQLKSRKVNQDDGEDLNRHNNQLCIPRRAIEVVFWASFEDLSDELQSCFLYFASYPENFSHPADPLVRMWIGEGFIRPQKGKTMEEVGQDYLKELVLRCLVEVEEKKAGGGIQLVRVHKSLMGFVQLEAREAGFMEIHDIHDMLVPPSARRLSVVHSDNNNRRRYTTAFTTHQKLPKLRSFLCHIIVNDHLHDFKLLSSAKFIRVISVRWFKIMELPDQIGDMIQLRYLHLDCPDLCHLPSSIAKLFNLQTLDISNTKVEVIDQGFWKIKTLRHVLARNLTLPATTPAVMEEGQDALTRNLTLPETTPTVMEEGQGDGSELQTLHGVLPIDSEEWSAVNCPLNNMTNLRSLKMKGFKDKKHGKDVFAAALSNMPHLGHLNLEGDNIPSCVFTDQSLRSLQTMEIRGIVDWNGITEVVVDPHFRQFRPNLIQLKLQNIGQVPQIIKKQLGEILVQG